MEHPEKALFDEVRGLRTNIEELKTRIEEIDKEYEEKVLNLQKRSTIDMRSNLKLEGWLRKRNDRVILQLNLKDYPFHRSTFTQNVYRVNFLTDEKVIVLDLNKSSFKAIIEIVRYGHDCYNNQTEEKPKCPTSVEKFLIDNRNLNLIEDLQKHFTGDSFLKIAQDLSLKYSVLGQSQGKDLLESYDIKSPYTKSELSENECNNMAHLNNPNNKDYGLFLNYSGSIIFKLKESIRVNKIYLKPFYGKTSVFPPSNGASNCSLLVSNDGKSWVNVTKIPSGYGSKDNNYLCSLLFSEYYTFNHILFETNSSSLFSLSYIAFTK